MKVLDFVVCEDIRQEVGEKFSLMGVYADSMLVHFRESEKWPFVTRLGFYIKLDPEGAPAYPDCKFQVARDGQVKSAIPLQVDTLAPGRVFVMMLNVQPFSISAPGILEFSLQFSGPGRESVTVSLPPFEVKTGTIGDPSPKVPIAQPAR
jgi:hypothetical protein